MNIFSTFWRNLTLSKKASERAFPPETLKAVEDAIKAGETTHRGEIRTIIETAMPTSELFRFKTSRERAADLFEQYGIGNTAERTGVLIYINCASRKIEILADKGISAKIPPESWQAVCSGMGSHFRKGEFREGMLFALLEINTALARHFPQTGPDTDELPNEPIVL